jgi:hypothetical protein
MYTNFSAPQGVRTESVVHILSYWMCVRGKATRSVNFTVHTYLVRTLRISGFMPPLYHINGYRVFPGGKAAGAWCWPSTPFYSRGQERVELYLYPPSGPSGLLGVPLTFYSIISLYGMQRNTYMLYRLRMRNRYIVVRFVIMKKIFCSPKHRYRPWGPSCFFFPKYQV